MRRSMKIKAANGVVRILQAEGVPWVSTFPVCSVNDGAGEEGFPILMLRDERYAVAVADAYSRMTNGQKIGACTVLGGAIPGGIQVAYGAIAQAFEDGSRLLCLLDSVPEAGGPITNYDLRASFTPITKWIGKIDKPEQVPDVMQRAFTQLRSGRPGPVIVSLSCGKEEYEEDEHPYKQVKGWRVAPDPNDVKAAIKALVSSKSPLLFVGEGVLYGHATDELLRFAELANVPVVTTLKAKSAFPENHPLSAGVRGEAAEHFLRKCDLLFAVGSSLLPGGRFRHAIPDAKEKTIVQCTLDELDINRGYRTDYAVIGDAKFTLRALADELAEQIGASNAASQNVKEEIRETKKALAAKYKPLMESNDTPINPYRVYGDLMKTIDLDASMVTPDSGNVRDQMSTMYETRIPRGFLGWGNVSTLGFSLAGAIAAKLAHPDWQCVNLTGDSGVGYMIGNFEPLVRHSIGITTIHINNGGFSGYADGWWGKGHFPYTHTVSDHSVFNTAESVRNMGCYAETVDEPAEIVPALKRAFDENAKGRPAFLEFICSMYPVFGPFIR